MKFLLRILSQRVIFPLLFLGVGLAQRCEGGLIGFETTGNLAHARAHHTATLLPNGKVLVAGGDNGAGNTFTSAELYDPASGIWTATGSLHKDRSDHTATLLSDGRVLVVGGRKFFYALTEAELYDPATGIWTPTGSLAIRRRNHTATLLTDGKVLVAGGSQESPSGSGDYSVGSAELYDPATGTWTATGNLVTARDGHTATLLPSGKVLVAGGQGSAFFYSTALSSAELYDPASGTWTSTGDMATARGFHTATLLPGDKVLVAGGYSNGFNRHLTSAEVYNSAAATWTFAGTMVAAHAEHTATLLPDNKVLVAGGFGGAGYPNGGTLRTAGQYNRGTWMITGSLLTARENHTATLLPNGTVLVAGGLNREGNSPNYLASAELYGKPTPTLLNISTRAHVLSGDKVLIGGFIITGTEQKTVIVRGIGPSLPVAGALADPVIEVHGPSGELLGTNDNWKDAATSQQISDSGLAPSNDLESALWGVIDPGAYTVILTGRNGGTGVGSVEVYDLDQAADSRLANISTRGFVDIGDNVMIGGLIVGGGGSSGTANVVVRALGPSIPLNGALANPTVELHDGNGAMIAVNDDWKTRADGSSQQAEIETTTIPPSNDLESAFVQMLPAGDYTAIVRGKNTTTGIGLVEVYHLP